MTLDLKAIRGCFAWNLWLLTGKRFSNLLPTAGDWVYRAERRAAALQEKL